jgi:hypothetical protein
LISSLLVAAAAAVFGAGPANAQSYGVMISSSSLAAHAGSAACDVNFKYGPNQVTCNKPDDPGHDYATASFGTAATSGQATTASTSVHEDGTAYYGGVGSSTTSVVVDLKSASLNMSSTDSGAAPAGGGSSGSTAGLNDTLHFSVAGAGADTHTTIGVTFTVDGAMSTSPNGQGEFYGGLAFGGESAQFYLGNFGNSATNPSQTLGTFSTYPAGFDNGVWTSNSDFTKNVFTGTFTLIGSEADLATSFSATLNCSDGIGGTATCNYGNTAISLQLPSDVTYTSDSGVFLTASAIAAAVPEPQTWALMVGGLALMGGAISRRRRRDGLIG